ncbi:MAG: nickel pincer cofactor biosynthesis protein LarC [Nitrospirae bacterium]|nr:nickel pincer cofactor biosynthesis protein LarC [Nitrospirota bacterium]
MKIAYIDCSSGVSGDMLNGAFIDCGVPIDYISSILSTFFISGFTIKSREVKKNGIRAVKFDVILDNDSPQISRTFNDIQELIDNSTISSIIKERAAKIFLNLFTVESIIHGTLFNNTHLHELGAVDCIVDICSALICLDFLAIDKVIVSPINLGGGHVLTSHGMLPVPAPATAALLCDVPVYSSSVDRELTTPTGAAILRGISNEFQSFPNMTFHRIGYGAGTLDLPECPNILRVFIGDEQSKEFSTDHVLVIETNIDDMSPTLYGYVMEKLFASGALDVYITPIIMKKVRPASKLTVITNIDKKDILSSIIFNETTTIGLRYSTMDRTVLEREIVDVSTEYGIIKMKVSKSGGDIINLSPEYEDCKSIALNHDLPLKSVMDLAVKAYKYLNVIN